MRYSLIHAKKGSSLLIQELYKLNFYLYQQQNGLL